MREGCEFAMACRVQKALVRTVGQYGGDVEERGDPCQGVEGVGSSTNGKTHQRRKVGGSALPNFLQCIVFGHFSTLWSKICQNIFDANLMRIVKFSSMFWKILSQKMFNSTICSIIRNFSETF